MAECINGAELFGKGCSGNLNRKYLKGLKGKKLEKTIEENLPYLVEWYFHHESKDDKFMADVMELLSNVKRFIRPLQKICSSKKYKKGVKEIDGLEYMLVEAKQHIYNRFNKKMGVLDGPKQTAEAKAAIDEMKQLCKQTAEEIDELVAVLAKKKTKLIVKMGIASEFAKELAPYMLNTKLITERNIRLLIHRFNDTLLSIQRKGLVRDMDDPDALVNKVGANLANKDNIKILYEYLLEGVDRKIYVNMIVGALLERRPNIINNNKPVAACYMAINNLLLDILEGNDAINYTGKKLKKSGLKKLLISNKERKTILKRFSDARWKDASKKRDAKRRIIFPSLDPETYPKTLKFFDKSNSDAIVDNILDDDGQQNQNNQQKGNGNNNQNQKNNNQKNN